MWIFFFLKLSHAFFMINYLFIYPKDKLTSCLVVALDLKDIAKPSVTITVISGYNE